MNDLKKEQKRSSCRTCDLPCTQSSGPVVGMQRVAYGMVFEILTVYEKLIFVFSSCAAGKDFAMNTLSLHSRECIALCKYCVFTLS